MGMALPINAPAPGMLGAIALADAAASLPISIAGLGVREKSFETLLSLWYGIAPAMAVKVSLTGLAVLALWAAAGAVCLLAFREKKLPEP